MLVVNDGQNLHVNGFLHQSVFYWMVLYMGVHSIVLWEGEHNVIRS